MIAPVCQCSSCLPVVRIISNSSSGTSFGDLTLARAWSGSCSSPTRGVIGGGFKYGDGSKDTMDYITIANTGNATDFGDLFGGARHDISALSGAAS